MLEKRIGYGSTLSVDSAGGTDYTEVASIVDGWSGPSTTADEIETTVLDDTYKTYARGQIDPGEITFQIAYDPADTNSQTLVELYSSCTVATWQVSLSAVCSSGGAAVTESFSGWVKAFSITASKNNLITADITVRITGDPGLTGTGS